MCFKKIPPMSPSFLQVMLALSPASSPSYGLLPNYGCILFLHCSLLLLLWGWRTAPVADIVNTMKDGFGNIMRSLGFIIVLGTALGVILEKNGSTTVMANYILKKIGKKYPALAMSLTGFISWVTDFLRFRFYRTQRAQQHIGQTHRMPVIIMAVSMATGLYSVHCLIPPHPGAAAAAGSLAYLMVN
jgi:GntP family gluconate:H+ symporter